MKYIKILSCLLFLAFLPSCETLDALHSDITDLTSGNLMTAQMLDGKSETLLESPCPKIELVDELSSLSDFTNSKKPKKANLISRIDLESAESSCKLASKSAIVDMKLIFNGHLGDKGRQKATDKPFFSYPYFVAITTPNGRIMAKEIFAASMTYEKQKNTHSYFEKLRQIIPIKNKAYAKHYRIMIGFQLTPEQLEYNRNNIISDNAISNLRKKIKNIIK